MGVELRRGRRGQVELGCLLDGIEAGKSPAAEDTPAGEGEWGVLKVSAVQAGSFASSENKVIRNAALIHPRYEVKHGDLLMTRANTEDLVGLACVAQAPPPRLLLSDKTLRLHVRESVADPRFVQLILVHPDIRRRIRSLATGTSAGMKNISQEQIRQLAVPDVPLDEQRRIVAAHAIFERRIATCRRIVAKLNSVGMALVEDTCAGSVVPLGEVLVAKPQNGYSPLEVPEWTGLQALGLGCLTPEGFVPRQLKRVPDTPQARRFLLSEGDLLMSRANTRELVGLAALYQDVGSPCIYPDLMMRLRSDESKCLSRYLELVLASSGVRRLVQTAARGTSESMVKISADTVESLPIPLPSMEHQHEVIAAVDALDRRSNRQKAVIAKTYVVQGALLNHLLATETRVSIAA